MTFQPMVEPILLAAALAVGLAMVAWRLFRPRSIASFIGWLARGLMLLLLVAVLLRPGIPTSSQPIQSTQADVFLVVDTTASIAAEDWSGNSPRLNGIKADIRTVVEQFAGARFALITFDRTAVLRVPLTSDAASVITASEVLQVEVSGYSKGSSIGLAAGLLEDQLRVAAREEPERGRAAFYFGDGEQTAATTPESFSGSARYLGGGRVYGYGTEAGGPMLANEGPRKKKQDYIIDTATGVPALSHSDPARLSTIAAELGVPVVRRDGSSAVTAGDVRGSAVTSDGKMARAGTKELYWIPALGLFGLLSVELGVILATLAASRKGGYRR